MCVPLNATLLDPQAPLLHQEPSPLTNPAAVHRVLDRLPGPAKALQGPFPLGPNCVLVVAMVKGWPMPFVAYGGLNAEEDADWAGPLEIRCNDMPWAATWCATSVGFNPTSLQLELSLVVFNPVKTTARVAVDLPGRSYINHGSADAVVWPYWASLLALQKSFRGGSRLPPYRVLDEFERAEQTIIGAVSAHASVADEWAQLVPPPGQLDELCKWIESVATGCALPDECLEAPALNQIVA